MASFSNHKPHFSKHPSTKKVTQPSPEKARKSQVFLGLSLMSLGVVLFLKWVPALAMTLPIFGISAVGYWLWTEFQQDQQQKRRRQTQIESTFYRMLQAHQGRINVLDFAVQAQLSQVAAQDYLNRQAQKLSAYVAANGTDVKPPSKAPIGLTYVFDLTANAAALSNHHSQYAPLPPLRAEAIWAAAEQARHEATRRNQAQAAWANAKQIRTLHKLSQSDSHDIKQIDVKQIIDREDNFLGNGCDENDCDENGLGRGRQLSGNASEEKPAPIQAGYIAISTIDSQGNEKASYPAEHHSNKAKTAVAQTMEAKTAVAKAGITKTLASKELTIDISVSQ